MTMTPAVYAVATMDTKGVELDYVAGRLAAVGVAVVTVDVGTQSEPQVTPNVSRQQVSGGQWRAQRDSDRGQAVEQMSGWLTDFLQAEWTAGRVLGVIGLGGSGGTALISRAMRRLPIGLPKLLVSTVASGNVAPYVGEQDILMMYSVVDIAGLNSVSRRILANAAAAMAGMVQQPPLESVAERPVVGLTMFGVTTPCVNLIRQELEAEGYDALVFHATGSGGRAMEQLAAAGFLSGVLDLTTTEVADEVVGGVFPAGAERFDRLLQAGIPLVVSLGALDMVNFGALETVPDRFRDRRLHVHNAQVTLMRTSRAECIEIGRWMAAKINCSTAPLVLLIPDRGLSLLDVPGQPFFDPEADDGLFETLISEIKVTADRQVLSLPHAINDPEFAALALACFRALVAQRAGN